MMKQHWLTTTTMILCLLLFTIHTVIIQCDDDDAAAAAAATTTRRKRSTTTTTTTIDARLCATDCPGQCASETTQFERIECRKACRKLCRETCRAETTALCGNFTEGCQVECSQKVEASFCSTAP